MAKLIYTEQTSAGLTRLYEEDGKLYKTQTSDMAAVLEQTKRERSYIQQYGHGKGLRPACNIPAALYYNLLDEAQSKGIPFEEQEKYIFIRLKSPEFDYFWVDPTLKGAV